jgi:hypothetical protein
LARALWIADGEHPTQFVDVFICVSHFLWRVCEFMEWIQNIHIYFCISSCVSNKY